MSDSDPVRHFAEIAELLGSPWPGLSCTWSEPPVQPDGHPVTAAAIRAAFKGPLIRAGGSKRADADKAVAGGKADLVAVGEAFIANPDLPQRWRLQAPLNAADKATFYTQGAKGYTDYPALELVGMTQLLLAQTLACQISLHAAGTNSPRKHSSLTGPPKPVLAKPHKPKQPNPHAP